MTAHLIHFSFPIIKRGSGRLLPFKQYLSGFGAATRSVVFFVLIGWGLSSSFCRAQAPPTAEGSRAPLFAPEAAPSASVAPAVTNAVAAPTGYVLSPNDQVAVEVFGEEDLRTNGRLNSEGNLSLPLLGSVKLAGLTLTQATSKLTDLYARDYLVSPKVNVSLIGYAKRRFTILGQVNRPGSYEMPESNPEGVDLLEAIAMAGGYTRIAAPERISIRRHDQVLRVDAKRLTKRKGGNFVVQPGDTITVGESLF